MTVESQLCPQCGSAIQFAKGQTKAVCAYCGTTVVNPSTLGSTSVKKELAAENLVQEMVGRERRLHSQGRPATAKILTAQTTDIFRDTVEGKGMLMSFAVEVQPEGEDPFNAETKCLVGVVAVSKYIPGTLLDVRYDPQDHTQVSVEGRDGVPSSNPEEQDWEAEAKLQAAAADNEDDSSDMENDGSVKAWKQLKKAQSQVAASDTGDTHEGEVPTPDWGKPSATGSVLVPAQFDPVTNLGKATAVYRHHGTMLFAALSRTKPNELVLYQDGLAFHTGGKEIHTWRWPEMAAILTNIHFTWQEFTLLKGNGEKLILEDDVGSAEFEKLIVPIKHAVYALLYPPLAQHYSAGQAVTFGPVTVHRTNGLEMDGKTYAWADIIEVKVDQGQLTVTMRDDHKHEVRTDEIPNVELLCRLIGLKLDPTQLRR